MDPRLIDVARSCLDAAQTGDMTFPEIVGALFREGFESYAIDFRRASATYYRADGDSVVLPVAAHGPVAERFDAAAIKAAILEAQTLAPGYTYAGFCDRVTAAGCTGYVVSFPGRRAVYSGRTAETHVEHFPS